MVTIQIQLDKKHLPNQNSSCTVCAKYDCRYSITPGFQIVCVKCKNIMKLTIGDGETKPFTAKKVKKSFKGSDIKTIPSERII